MLLAHCAGTNWPNGLPVALASTIALAPIKTTWVPS